MTDTNKTHQSKSKGLQWQLSFWILITVTVISVLFGGQRIQSQRDSLRQNLAQSVQINMQLLTNMLPLPLYNYDTKTVETICLSLLAQKDIVRVVLQMDGKDTVFEDSHQENGVTATENITVETAAIKYEKMFLSDVQVYVTDRKLKRELRSLTVSAVIEIIIMDLLLVLVITFFISRKFVQPMTQLQQAAGDIATGNLLLPINISCSNELGSLARSLEVMRQSLQEKIKNLQSEIGERQKAENELKKAKNYIDNIFNSMPSLLIGVDSAGKVTQWNSQAERISGIDSVDAAGQLLNDVLPYFEVQQEKIIQAVSTREIQHENVQIIGETGLDRVDDITIYPLVANGVSGAVIRIDDVTEQHRIREELSHSRKLEAIGQLAGGIAHDFNNMLSGIMGGAQMLELRLGQDEKTRECLQLILNSSQRASELTKKLLTFARKGKIERKTIDLATVVQEATGLLQHTIDKRITIQSVIETDHTMVTGDPGELLNVLINLGINGGHAMANGGTLTFLLDEVRLDKVYCQASPFALDVGQYLEIEIRDTGTGIPFENLQHIFTPFFTTKDPGKGTGLGLAAAYGTIQEHHGAITVYSEEGTGTRFHIFLPLSDPDIQVPDELPVSDFTGQGCVLVIDDDPIVRDTVEAILVDQGYEVLFAENGREGLEVYNRERDRLDLVIMDIVMPEMNGEECFLAMKEIDPAVKVLLFSGFSRDVDVEQLIQQGLKGFIRKPFTVAALSQAVVKAMS